MRNFNINYMFGGKRDGNFYYNDDDFTKYIIHLLEKLFDDNQFGLSISEFYDMGVELSGIPSGDNFVIESIKFNYIIEEPDVDINDDEDGLEYLEFLESNADYELFSVPQHLQFNLVNFISFDENLFLKKFPKVGFQLYRDSSLGKGYKSYCLRPGLPFYFES